MVDRHTRTRIVAWGAALWSAAMVFTGLATSYLALFLSRMFLGVAESSYTPGGFSLLSDYYPVNERGKVMGQFRAAAILAFVTLPVAGIITNTWGWRTAFHLYAIPGFLLALVAWRLHEPPRGAQDLAHQGLSAGVPGTKSAFAEMSTGQAFALMLRVPTMLVLLLGELVSTFLTAGLTIWWTVFLVRYHDMSLTSATSLTALFGIFGVAGVLGGGYLGDRLVKQGRPAGRLYVVGVSKVLCALVLIPTIATGSTALFSVLMLPGAMFLTAPAAPLAALQADVVHPDLRGRLMSVTTVLRATGGALSPLLFGILSDAYTLRTAELVLVPLLGIAGAAILVVGPTHLAPDIERMRRQLTGEELPTARRAAR